MLTFRLLSCLLIQTLPFLSCHRVQHQQRIDKLENYIKWVIVCVVWNSIYVCTMCLYMYVVLTFSHWINWNKNMKHSPEKLSKYVIGFAQIVSHFWITLMCPKVFIHICIQWIGWSLNLEWKQNWMEPIGIHPEFLLFYFFSYICWAFWLSYYFIQPVL